jgi:hypothetical protein
VQKFVFKRFVWCRSLFDGAKLVLFFDMAIGIAKFLVLLLQF